MDCDGNCAGGGVLYQFDISDVYGDGMCCTYGEGSYSITVDGAVVASGSDFGGSASHTFCAAPDACVLLEFIADDYPGEQSWSLSADGIQILGDGLDGSTATYGAGGCVGGCSDDTACNYDADAVLDYDDGSCTYIAAGECDCDGNVEDALGECGGHARQTLMQTASATTWTIVLVLMTNAAYATATTHPALVVTGFQEADLNLTIVEYVVATTAAALAAWTKRPAITMPMPPSQASSWVTWVRCKSI